MIIQLFDEYQPKWITINVQWNVASCNLPILFYCLPTTSKVLPENVRTKKKSISCCSIIYPSDWDVDEGEILSIRYKSDVRGIVKTEAESFDNCITIDMKVKDGYVNLKVNPSKNVEVTGTRNVESAREAIEYLTVYMKEIEENFQRLVSYGGEAPAEILQKFYVNTENPYFLVDAILSGKITNVYSGNCEILTIHCEMFNYRFDLGVCLKMKVLSEILSQYFFCTYNNANSEGRIYCIYRLDRANATLRISRLGEVMLISYNNDLCRIIYYMLYAIILQNFEKVISYEMYKKRFTYDEAKFRVYSTSEWCKKLQQHGQLKKILEKADINKMLNYV